MGQKIDEFTFRGVCVECIAHNQCPGKGCNFEENKCATAANPGPYVTRTAAQTEYIDPNSRIQETIGKLSAEGVADLFASTR